VAIIMARTALAATIIMNKVGRAAAAIMEAVAETATQVRFMSPLGPKT